ncbi:hypothetical protein ABT095_09105 [Kitasatospora sp. NPDC002227]|uniref:hypothetical protein n=1 Tax=Kitasatospora sp. NPDC002227 TaxID=3154773 RepID=UPI00332739BB
MSHRRSYSPRRAAIVAGALTAGLLGTLVGCGGDTGTTASSAPSRSTAATLTASAAPSTAPSPAPTPTGSAPAPTASAAPARSTAPQTAPPGAPDAPDAPSTPVATASGGPQRLPNGSLLVAPTAKLDVTLTGLPEHAVLKPGSPVEFSAVVENTGSSDYVTLASVVRLKQYDGGLAPLGSVGGTLQRLDPATGAWQNAPLPQASGMDYLLAATGAKPLPKGAKETIRYRLSLDPALKAGTTEIQFYAVSQPNNLQAGTASLPVSIA